MINTGTGRYHIKEPILISHLFSHSMSEMQKDMALIRTGLKDIQKELDFQRSRPADACDLFVPTMKEFAAKATYKCRQLEDEFSDMRTRVSRSNIRGSPLEQTQES